jgi:hypothetical protein
MPAPSKGSPPARASWRASVSKSERTRPREHLAHQPCPPHGPRLRDAHYISHALAELPPRKPLRSSRTLHRVRCEPRQLLLERVLQSTDEPEKPLREASEQGFWPRLGGRLQ